MYAEDSSELAESGMEQADSEDDDGGQPRHRTKAKICMYILRTRIYVSEEHFLIYASERNGQGNSVLQFRPF